jgi:hypothetical protein
MGSYEIGDLLGAGGMGTVYRAHDTRLKRDVAIKVLSEEVTHDRERLARFEPAETPPTIRRLLARCLERDPKERLHDAGDARLEIDEAIAERRPGTTSQIARIDVLEPRRSWSRRSLVPLLIVCGRRRRHRLFRRQAPGSGCEGREHADAIGHPSTRRLGGSGGLAFARRRAFSRRPLTGVRRSKGRRSNSARLGPEHGNG